MLTVDPTSTLEPVDFKNVADGDLVLAAATSHDRVHAWPALSSSLI